MNAFKTILFSAIVLMVLDFAFLALNQKAILNQIVDVQRVILVFRPLGAVICYALLVFALYYFILRDRRSPFEAFLLGIIIYGVYDSTNYASLKKWGALYSMIDTLWGGILFATTTWIIYFLKIR